MKKETDVTHMASMLAQSQEKPMDTSIDQNAPANEQWYGPDNNGQFGPLEPMSPFPLGGDPRQWQFRPAWNLPTSPQNDRNVDTDLLRTLADTYDLLRKCIEIRKFEICSLEWDIVPREKNQKKAKELNEKYSALIDEIKAFFMYPEAYLDETPKGFVRKPIRTYDEWLSALLEDYFVLDAMTIYPRPKKNGELLALERVDGSTIKPLLTIDGRVPIPPAPAYQQFLYGMPRASLSLKQLYYKPRNVRNHTPYGFSHVEQALSHINLALRTQMWYMSYFTNGSIPEGLLKFPDSWTPEQIWGFIDRLNSMVAGNPSALRQFIPAPSGGDWINLKEFTMNEDLISYIVTTTCAIMDIQPMEVGYMPKHGGGGLGGTGFADAQNLVHQRKSLVPTARWLESIFTQIIHDWWDEEGSDELEFAFVALHDVEDRERDEVDINLVKSGLKSIDEYVLERGGEPPGIGRIFVTGSQVLFEPDLIKGTKEGMAAIAPTPSAPQPKQEDNNDSENQPTQDEQDQEKQDGQSGLEKLVQALLIKSDNQSNDDQSDENDFIDWFTMFMLALIARARRQIASNQPAKLAFKVTQQDTEQLANALFELQKKTYLSGLNDQLAKLGLPLANDISDPQILSRLQQQAHQTAQGIMQTLKDDLNAELEQLLKQGLHGQELVDQLVQWLSERTAWKAKQIAVTEGNRSFTDGIADFLQTNGLHADAEYWVQPDGCKCDKCQALVDGNPYYGDQGLEVMGMLPLHPNCVHSVEVKYGKSSNNLDSQSIWMG